MCERDRWREKERDIVCKRELSVTAALVRGDKHFIKQPPPHLPRAMCQGVYRYLQLAQTRVITNM